MVERIDQQCDIFAHIAVEYNMAWTGAPETGRLNSLSRIPVRTPSSYALSNLSIPLVEAPAECPAAIDSLCFPAL